LSAANVLTQHGLNVLVLEARDRVGGRTLTKTTGSLWCDLGGSYVGPTQDCLLRLVEEFGLETYKVDETKAISYLAVKPEKSSWHSLFGSRWFSRTKPPDNGCSGDTTSTADSDASKSGTNLTRQKSIASRLQRRPITGLTPECRLRRARFMFDESVPVGNWFERLDFNNVIRLMDTMGATIPSDAPWNAPQAQLWDSMSFREWIQQTAWTQSVRNFFNELFIAIDVTVEASDASLLWLLWYVKQCGGVGRSISTTNGGQERKVCGGTQQISLRLREKLGASKVLLNKPVYKVDQTLGPMVVLTTCDGAQYQADYVIFAFPPHLQLKIHYSPPLPPEKTLLAQRSPMGMVAKVILYYETAFWKQRGLCGSLMLQTKDHFSHPVVFALDETKPDGSHPAIIAFVPARSWYETRSLSKEDKGRLVARCFADATGYDEFLTPIAVEHFDWTSEQYSGGCYTTTHSPGALTKFGHALRQPYGRIYYAGTETAIKWSGYMDGAVSAGERAAREILHRLGRIDETQIWQVEPESRIVPATPYEYSWWTLHSPTPSAVVKSSLLASSIVFVILLHATKKMPMMHARFCS
ncbi:Amine oxidase [flavin-containing], partial [Fragariocoptes setiger]